MSKKANGPGSTECMIDKIRKAMSECTVDEYECYEALVDESEGWRMRLRELEEERGSNDH